MENPTVGSFYRNIVLKGPPSSEIMQFLMQVGRKDVYMSPTLDDATVLYDSQIEKQDDELKFLSALLSRRFQCPVLAAGVYDSDIFYYWLYDSGELIDEYNSAPGLLDDDYEGEPLEPKGGDAKKLCNAFGAEHVVDKVDTILRYVCRYQQDDENKEKDKYVFEDMRHYELVEALGLSPFAANLGYDRIQRTTWVVPGYDPTMYLRLLWGRLYRVSYSTVSPDEIL